MKNFIFVSPNFPVIFSHFVKALHDEGFNVLGIGDTPYNEINDELKNNLTEYYYVYNMNDYNQLFKAVAYFSFKYGHIDELESNNEYWLDYDSRLRHDFNINGIKDDEIIKFKRKDKMKEYYKSVDIPVANYTLVKDLHTCLDFIREYDYPVFVKPVIGVGANDSYKITNLCDLMQFYLNKDNQEYIMEQYIEGVIYSFDGIADKNSEIACYASHVFTFSNSDLVNKGLDSFYYMDYNPSEELIKKGKATVKAFNVKKRCFHLEFFKLNKDIKDVAKKDEYVALEVNMRVGGGNVPDLISLGAGYNFYKCYAKIMNEEDFKLEIKDQYIVIEVIRRKNKKYVYNEDTIIKNYNENICTIGHYSKEIAPGMGGENYYIAKFKNLNDALIFKDKMLLKQE